MIKKITAAVFAVLLLPVFVSAETRDIYIGDIIALEITSESVSADELKKKFQDFELIELKEQNGVYSVSLRTFITGEHIINLGNKEIIINVKSTLEDISRDDIFEGGARVAKPGAPFYRRVIFYVPAAVFIFSCGFVSVKKIIKKTKKTQTPLQLFLNNSSRLSPENKNYLADLTYNFKNYLEALYKFKIIGKTTGEIVNELKKIQELNGALPDIFEWLTECDRMKFTGVYAQNEEKEDHCKKLIGLVEKIDKEKEGAP